jgi:hypothetical protein
MRRDLKGFKSQALVKGESHSPPYRVGVDVEPQLFSVLTPALSKFCFPARCYLEKFHLNVHPTLVPLLRGSHEWLQDSRVKLLSPQEMIQRQ